jgi:hypothetical protein
MNNTSSSGDASHVAIAGVTPVSAWRVPSALDSEHDDHDSGNVILPVQMQAGIPRQTSRTRKGWSKQPLNSILGHVRQQSNASSSGDSAADDTVQQQQQQQQQSMSSHDVYTDDTAVCDDIEYTEYEDDFELTHDSLDGLQQQKVATDKQSSTATAAVQLDADTQHDVRDVVNDDDTVDSADHIEIIDDTLTDTAVIEDTTATATQSKAVYDEPMTVSDISSDDDDAGSDTSDINNNGIADDTTADNITTTSTGALHDDRVVSQKHMRSSNAVHASHGTATLATAGNVIATTPRSSKGKHNFYLYGQCVESLLDLCLS